MTVTEKKKVLVYGASGKQGGAVALELLQNGYEVYAVARTAEQIEQLRAAGITAFRGDLNDTGSLYEAIQHVQIVYFQLPVNFDLPLVRRYFQNAIDTAKLANVELLVVNTNVFVPENLTDSDAIEIKRELKAYARDSGLPVIYLQPTLYLENLYIPGVFEGNVLAYPVPADHPIAWVSLKDAAKHALYAIKHPGLAGQTIQVTGPQAASGKELAEHLSQALAKPVHFHPLALSDFESALAPLLGAQTSAGLAGLYRWIGNNSNQLPQPDRLVSEESQADAGTSLKKWFEASVRSGIFK